MNSKNNEIDKYIDTYFNNNTNDIFLSNDSEDEIWVFWERVFYGYCCLAITGTIGLLAYSLKYS